MQIDKPTPPEHAEFLALVDAEIRPHRAKTHAWDDFPLILHADNRSSVLIARGDDGRQGVFDLLSEFEAETSVKKREELIPDIAGELKALYEIPADKAPSNRLLEKIACDFGVKEVLKAGIVQEGACLLGKGEFYILYSAESKTMKNYVLAHELGHLMMDVADSVDEEKAAKEMRPSATLNAIIDSI